MGEGKGSKDRATILPASIEERLLQHFDEIKALHEKDLSRGGGYVRLPNGLDRKYPTAEQEWSWQWIFPATRQFKDADSGRVYRHLLHETVLQQNHLFQNIVIEIRRFDGINPTGESGG